MHFKVAVPFSQAKLSEDQFFDKNNESIQLVCSTDQY